MQPETGFHIGKRLSNWPRFEPFEKLSVILKMSRAKSMTAWFWHRLNPQAGGNRQPFTLTQAITTAFSPFVH